MKATRPVALALVATLAALAPSPLGAAEPIVLHMATIAMDGTAWARELRVFSSSLEQATQGQLRVRWYFGGATGDEIETLRRIKGGQLQGAVFGGACSQVAPSFAILSLPGVSQNRDEAVAVMSYLQPMFEAEGHRAGFYFAGSAAIGPTLIFSRTPVRDMAGLRKLRLWRWNIETVGVANAQAMGLTVRPLEIYDAARAFDDNKVDGFLAVPQVALAWQFSTQAHYLVDLRDSYLFGCMLVTDSVFARIPSELQAAFRSASARLAERMQEQAQRSDDVLLSGGFQKQGIKSMEVSDRFRAEYFAAARDAREKVARHFGLEAALDRALRLLADYRSEHNQSGGSRP